MNDLLVDACQHGRSLIVIKFLVYIGRADRYNITAFLWACRTCTIPVIKFLLGNGININAVDAYGSTALIHYAAMRSTQSLEVIKFLVGKGADINKASVMNETVLMYACLYGPIEVIEFLIDNGALINTVSVNGTTALKNCLYRQQPSELIKLLVNKGADVNVIIDNKDGTTLQHACKYELSLEIIQFLIDHGAVVDENLIQFCNTPTVRDYIQSIIDAKVKTNISENMHILF